MKKTLVPVMALTIAGILSIGVMSVSAHGFGDNSEFVKIFSQKLGVSEEKVQSAFESMHTERKAQMQKNHEEQLNQAVKNGKITEEQKSKILAKIKELQAQRETKKGELKKWADENGIDTQYLRFGYGMKGYRFK